VTERENLFRPIHKGIRAMIYELGRRLQTTDFTDETAALAISKDLRDNLSQSVGNCLLCLLHEHSRHEERDIFRPLRPFDPELVALMMREHVEVVKRIGFLSKTCAEMMAETSPARRIEVGDRLNLEANDVFAYYLQHLNNEEATLVPVMWERFTDEELRQMRAKFHSSIPRHRLETWMRWTLPALNVNELVVFFRGMKSDGHPRLYDDLVELAAETVDPVQWESAKVKLAL